MDIEAKVITFYYDVEGKDYLRCTNEDGMKIRIEVESNWVGIESSDGVTLVNLSDVKYFEIDK